LEPEGHSAVLLAAVRPLPHLVRAQDEDCGIGLDVAHDDPDSAMILSSEAPDGKELRLQALMSIPLAFCTICAPNCIMSSSA